MVTDSDSLSSSSMLKTVGGGVPFRLILASDFGSAFLVDGLGFFVDFALALLTGFRVEARGLLFTPLFRESGGGDIELVARLLRLFFYGW